MLPRVYVGGGGVGGGPNLSIAAPFFLWKANLLLTYASPTPQLSQPPHDGQLVPMHYSAAKGGLPHQNLSIMLVAISLSYRYVLQRSVGMLHLTVPV